MFREYTKALNTGLLSHLQTFRVSGDTEPKQGRLFSSALVYTDNYHAISPTHWSGILIDILQVNYVGVGVQYREFIKSSSFRDFDDVLKYPLCASFPITYKRYMYCHQTKCKQEVSEHQDDETIETSVCQLEGDEIW